MFISEHPFNLKGGVGGAMGFFWESKYLFRFETQRKTLFFIYKSNFFKAQSDNRTFVSAHFRDRNVVSTKFADRIFPPEKTHNTHPHPQPLKVKWMFP